MGEGAAERWLVWTGIKRSVCWWVECFRPRMCLRRWPRGFRWCRVFRVANVPRGELPDSLRTSGGGRHAPFPAECSGGTREHLPARAKTAGRDTARGVIGQRPVCPELL